MSDTDAQGLGVVKANLLALIIETLAFGALTPLYGISVWILLYRERGRSRSFLNKALFVTSTFMWILSLVHFSLDAYRAVLAFVDNAEVPQGALILYSQLNHPTHVARTVIFIIMTVVGDSFVTYRLWVVWGRVWWIVIVPALLIIGTGIGGFTTCYKFGTINNAADLLSSDLVPWTLSFFSMSLATNVLCTLLITARISWSARKVRKYRATKATSQWDVIETLVQSAAIYSAALITLLTVYLAGSNAQFIVLDLMQPLIGITFTLIIIRVGLGYTVNSATGGGKNISTDQRGGASSAAPSDGYPMRPVAINVQVSREHDGASLEDGSYDAKDTVDLESGKGVAH